MRVADTVTTGAPLPALTVVPVSVAWNAIGCGTADLAGDPARTRRRRRRRASPATDRASRWRRAARPIGARPLPAPGGARSRRPCGLPSTTSRPACPTATSCSASSSSRVDARNQVSSSFASSGITGFGRGLDVRARRRARRAPRTAAPDRGARSTRRATSRGTTAPGLELRRRDRRRGRRALGLDEPEIRPFEHGPSVPTQGIGARGTLFVSGRRRVRGLVPGAVPARVRAGAPGVGRPPAATADAVARAVCPGHWNGGRAFGRWHLPLGWTFTVARNLLRRAAVKRSAREIVQSRLRLILRRRSTWRCGTPCVRCPSVSAS